MIRKILAFLLLVITTQLTLAQAPGTDCASAAPITLAPGTTVSTGLHTVANPGGTYAGTGCDPGSSWYTGGDDGIYSINVTIPGDYTFAFANNGTTWKSLSVHNTCPPTNGADCIGGVGTGSFRDNSRTLTLAAGMHYIVIDCWSAAATYPPTPGATPIPTFELLITSPISNDDCSGAVELFSDVDCTFKTYTNAGATGSVGAPAPGCANYQGGDVWFSYEVNITGEFTITTQAGVISDSGMAVYSGTCGSLVLLDCDDDFGTGLMSTITITGRTPGEIVYIRLWEYGNNNNGTFGICITTPIPPGDNGVYHDCPNERSQSLTSDFTCPPGINSSNTVFGNLDGAPTADRQNSAANNTTCNTNVGAARRYEGINFTVPTTGLYVIDMTAAAGFDGMGYIIVNDGLYTIGSCATGTFVIRDDDSGAGLNSRLTVTLTAGTPYTLITTEFNLGSGNSPYTWTVTTGPNINWETVFPIEWYTTASGGTPIETGPGFNPVNYPGSGLTDTSVAGIYSYWYACPTTPAVRTRVDYVIGKHWEGSTSSDWNTASNWHGNSVPTNSQCVYIPDGTVTIPVLNDPIVPDDYDADGLNLTVRNGASLTLASDVNTNNFGSSLTIQDYISVEGTGSLIVDNDASLIQVNDTPSVPNSGNITVNRIANVSRTDYVYWASPVQGTSVSSVYGANTPLSYIFEWIPTVPTGLFGPPADNAPICFGEWNNNSTLTMSPGQGYAVRGPNDHSNVTSIDENVTFNGVPNNGVITQQILSGTNPSTNSPYVNTITNNYGLTVTASDDNWNLLGNPYPSALDATAFLSSNTALEGSVHIWTHSTQIGNNGQSFYTQFGSTYDVSDYISFNFSGPSYPDTSFSGKIASGQGFFVMALNDNESGNVTFNNSMRSRTHSNTDFYRTTNDNENTIDSNTLERHRIWLDLVDPNNASSNILVGYIEGATQEKDRLYDALAREANSLSLYSKIGNQRMIIQGRSLPFDENDQVSLGTVIPQSGEYTIAISAVDGLFLEDSQNIYLEDTHNDVIHNLRAAPYTFTATESADYGDRFILRYTDDALSINEFDLDELSIVAPKGNYIKINSETSPIAAVTVFDLLGRSLIDKFNIGNTEFILTNHNLSSGAYLVKVTLNNGLSKTQKVILKQ